MSPTENRENSDESPKKGDTSIPQGPGGIISPVEHSHSLSELNLLGRALKSRWPITENIKQETVDSVHKLAKSAKDEKVRVAAARVLTLMEGQNARDEYVFIAADARKKGRYVPMPEGVPDIPPSDQPTIVNQNFINVIGQLSDDQLDALDSVFGALARGSVDGQVSDPGRKEETPPRTP